MGKFSQLPTGLIATAVEDADKHLAQSVIRDYILLLVERRACMELALLAANPESIVGADSNRLTRRVILWDTPSCRLRRLCVARGVGLAAMSLGEESSRFNWLGR